MYLDDVAKIADVVEKTHFLIVSVPRRYGYDEIFIALKKYEFFVIRPDEKGSISVDAVRYLSELCRNKQSRKMVFVVQDAEKMTDSASNAFLKLLEEPVENIVFLLLTYEYARLIDTVKSRGQMYYMQKRSYEWSKNYVEELNPRLGETAKQQVLFLAEGLPSELKKLVSDMDYFTEKKELIVSAKTLISGEYYEVLLLAQCMKDEREKLIEIVDLAITMLNVMLKKAPTKSLIKKMEELMNLKEGLMTGANVRLAVAGNIR